MQEGQLRRHHSNFSLWFLSQEFFYSCLHAKFKSFRKKKKALVWHCVWFIRESLLLQRLARPLRSCCSDVFVKHSEAYSWYPDLSSIFHSSPGFFSSRVLQSPRRVTVPETPVCSIKSENPSLPTWQVITCYGVLDIQPEIVSFVIKNSKQHTCMYEPSWFMTWIIVCNYFLSSFLLCPFQPPPEKVGHMPILPLSKTMLETKNSQKRGNWGNGLFRPTFDPIFTFPLLLQYWHHMPQKRLSYHQVTPPVLLCLLITYMHTAGTHT